MKHATVLLLVIAAVVAGALGMGYISQQEPAQEVVDQALGDIVRFTGSVTSTGVYVAAQDSTDASTLVVATSSERQYLAIVNDSANTVYICLTMLGCDGNTGIRLNANGGSYEINQENLYTGPVYGSASSTSRLTVTYK